MASIQAPTRASAAPRLPEGMPAMVSYRLALALAEAGRFAEEIAPMELPGKKGATVQFARDEKRPEAGKAFRCIAQGAFATSALRGAATVRSVSVRGG